MIADAPVADIIRRTLLGLDHTLQKPALDPATRDLLRLHQIQVQNALHEGVTP